MFLSLPKLQHSYGLKKNYFHGLSDFLAFRRFAIREFVPFFFRHADTNRIILGLSLIINLDFNRIFAFFVGSTCIKYRRDYDTVFWKIIHGFSDYPQAELLTIVYISSFEWKYKRFETFWILVLSSLDISFKRFKTIIAKHSIYISL